MCFADAVGGPAGAVGGGTGSGKAGDGWWGEGDGGLGEPEGVEVEGEVLLRGVMGVWWWGGASGLGFVLVGSFVTLGICGGWIEGLMPQGVIDKFMAR